MPLQRAASLLRLVDEVRPSPALAPSRGELDLTFVPGPSGARLTRAYQAGCLRVRTPRHDEGVVLINTGGGVVGGDVLRQSLRWEAGARAVVASQAAEKVYRSAGATAQIHTRLQVGADAQAEWLPQETILFDHARLDRRLEVELAPGARFLGVEAVVFGRAAMGEAMTHGFLRDAWRVRRGGELIYADALQLRGPMADLLARPAVGAGARAIALILQVCDSAATRLEAVRAALADLACRAAASAWNGLLAVRLLAPDGQSLKAGIAAALAVLRDGRPLPRVWTC